MKTDIAPIPGSSQRRAIPVRLTAGERARLEAIAAAWGVSLAAAIRRLIREADQSER